MIKHKKPGFTPLNPRGGARSNLTGFTLIELIVVIAIVALLAAFTVIALSPVIKKGRDAKRKSDINQIGRFLSLSCYLPDTGPGQYDLALLFNEIKTKNPQISSFIKSVPKDPLMGTDSQSYYLYEVTAEAKKCVLSANLENDNEAVTLTAITAPTPGGGNGVFEAETAGPNKSKKYFQFSN